MSIAQGKIVCAFAEPAAGPGWANSPLWYILRDGNGTLTMHCLQPDEQTAEIGLLYRTSAALHGTMVQAVENAIGKKQKRRTPSRAPTKKANASKRKKS